MIIQHSNYGTVSTEIQSLIASKISILDKYVLMRTDENEYTALVHNPLSKNTTQYVISRSSASGYNNPWVVTTIEDVDYRFNISNEYYVYSNEGYGRMLDLPVYDAVSSFGLCILTCTLIFAIAFKGVLFKCLRKK